MSIISIVKKAAAVVSATILLALALIPLSEVYTVCVGGGADYHFGSEAMIAHGGFAYRSATAYVTTALLEGLPLLTAALLLFAYAKTGKPRLAIGAFGAVSLFLMVRLIHIAEVTE